MTLPADEVLRMAEYPNGQQYTDVETARIVMCAFNVEQLQSFANAIYQLGIAEGERREREACAQYCRRYPVEG